MEPHPVGPVLGWLAVVEEDDRRVLAALSSGAGARTDATD